MLAPLNKVNNGPKGKKILCKYRIVMDLKEIKIMLSYDAIPNYPDCIIKFTSHTDTSQK